MGELASLEDYIYLLDAGQHPTDFNLPSESGTNERYITTKAAYMIKESYGAKNKYSTNNIPYDSVIYQRKGGEMYTYKKKY